MFFLFSRTYSIFHHYHSPLPNTKMSLTSVDIIYEGRGNMGKTCTELYVLGYFDNPCKTLQDVVNKHYEFSLALATLDEEDIYNAAYYLCTHSHFELEDPCNPGNTMSSSITDLINYKSKFEDTPAWSAFIQNMKTALLRQRFAELKAEVAEHIAAQWRFGFIQPDRDVKQLTAVREAAMLDLESVCLENLCIA